jgi:hypothetical protein
MLLHLRLFLLLAATVIPWVVADVEFTTPAPGASVPGGTTITVEWKDSGKAPSLEDLTSFQLYLCAGSNDNPVGLRYGLAWVPGCRCRTMLIDGS